MWRASEGSGSLLQSSCGRGVEAMCLLGSADPDAGLLHCLLACYAVPG